MKKSIFYLCLLLAGCKSDQKPEGIYVCQFENEFSKIADTLWLQKLNAPYYKITRRSGVTNVATKKKQLITEIWKLEFQAQRNMFTELKKGKIILWDVDKQMLLFGNRDYKKP